MDRRGVDLGLSASCAATVGGEYEVRLLHTIGGSGGGIWEERYGDATSISTQESSPSGRRPRRGAAPSGRVRSRLWFGFEINVSTRVDLDLDLHCRCLVE